MSTSHANHVAECPVECYCETRHIRIFIDSDIRRERHFVCMSFFFIIVQSIFRRDGEKKERGGGGSLYTANEQPKKFFLQDLSSVGNTFTVPHDDTFS